MRTSYLNVPAHIPEKAKYPAIDAHNHLWGDWSSVDAIVNTMDETGVSAYCDLTGNLSIKWVRNGYEFSEGNIDDFFANASARHQGRFYGFTTATFCSPVSEPLYDDPVPFAEKTIGKFKLTDRIDFVAGNYVEDEIDGKYDAAWLSHILHGEGPQTCREIIQKTVSALEPGATIVVHDFILDNSMDGPLFPALFSLNMLLGTSSGQSYSENQIMDMLSGAGVKNIRRIPVQSPNDSGIILGTI